MTDCVGGVVDEAGDDGDGVRGLGYEVFLIGDCSKA